MSFNPHQWYLMGSPPREPNLFIGGVASTINTPALLAAKLNNYPSGTAFSASNIQNFQIDGDNISCYVSADYQFAATSFQSNTDITYYFDYERCKIINSSAFYVANGVSSNLKYVEFTNVLSIGNNSFKSDANNSKLEIASFPNCLSVGTLTAGSDAFTSLESIKIINLPQCTTYGANVLNSENFRFSKPKVYAEPTMETINGGSVEGDLAYVISNGGSVVYVANYTAPNPITDLAVGNVYGTAIQLTFTPPSSTNTIDFYEVYVDGVYNNKISGSGDYATGLTLNTSYNITVKAVDIYYNKSEISNEVTQTTNASLTFPYDNIVSYWKFENNVLDSVGSNNGTATSITYTTGQVGNAAVFNGSTSYISVADDNSLSFGNGSTDSAFSVSCIINSDILLNSSSGVNCFILDRRALDNTSREYAIYYSSSYNGGSLIFRLFDTTSNTSVNVYIENYYTTTFTSGTLYQITATYDGSGISSGLKLYVNNISVGTANTSGSYTAMGNKAIPLIVGKQANISGYYFDGKIDELTIFNKELSAGEVADIYTTLNAGNHLI